jgi:hypothetical protein
MVIKNKLDIMTKSAAKKTQQVREIVKFTAKDKIPTNAKFLYAKEEFKGMFGWVSNLKPNYETVFYYEVDNDN